MSAAGEIYEGKDNYLLKEDENHILSITDKVNEIMARHDNQKVKIVVTVLIEEI